MKAGSQFTGEVFPYLTMAATDGVTINTVNFTPCARTYWHSHEKGQILIVVAGRGLVQADGGPVCVMRAGDTVWAPPGERHWHGAAPDSVRRPYCHFAGRDLMGRASRCRPVQRDTDHWGAVMPSDDTHEQTYYKGLEVRRAVLGADHVDRSLAQVSDFARPMQELVTEYCWGVVWTA